KKHNAINYHVIRESVASNSMRVGKIDGKVNKSDALTKLQPYNTKIEQLDFFIYRIQVAALDGWWRGFGAGAARKKDLAGEGHSRRTLSRPSKEGRREAQALGSSQPWTALRACAHPAEHTPARCAEGCHIAGAAARPGHKGVI
ncbi:hypothetical protein THAOC_19697, partial [Thalassiosira oceanica]